MARYIPQDVFNYVAAMVAMSAADSNKPIEEVAAEFCVDFQHSYSDDVVDLTGEVAESAEEALRYLRSLPGPESRVGNIVGFLHCFAYYTKKFDGPGRKKPFRIFNGIWFTAPRQPVLRKKQNFMKWIGIYHMMIRQGTAPLPPKG